MHLHQIPRANGVHKMRAAHKLGDARPLGPGAGAGKAGIVRSQVTPVRTAIDAPAGSFYVPLNQGLANLAVAALEPDTESSYFANRLIDSLASTARVMSVPSLVFEEADH